MPKIHYRTHRFEAHNLAIVENADRIIRKYQAQGFVLTVRQIYYQLVTEKIIANKQAEYKRVVKHLNNARIGGYIDWLGIEDRTRRLVSNAHWDSPESALHDAADVYAIDKWAGQPNRPEIWIEKDALAGIIDGICGQLDVGYFSCRGNSSATAMWGAAQRFTRYFQAGQTPVVIHLGDHDPSGVDMTRDIEDRLGMFLDLTRFPIRRIALNMDQVTAWGLPPDPAKPSDSRYKGYVETFGHEDCWELDAMEPQSMVDLIEETVLGLRDESLYNIRRQQEEDDRARLEGLVGVLTREQEDEDETTDTIQAARNFRLQQNWGG